jgi:hypothetical protein
MPHQVDDAVLHAMPGTELSRVRTEPRLLPPSLSIKVCSCREEPTLLCNQVEFWYGIGPVILPREGHPGGHLSKLVHLPVVGPVPHP